MSKKWINTCYKTNIQAAPLVAAFFLLYSGQYVNLLFLVPLVYIVKTVNVMQIRSRLMVLSLLLFFVCTIVSCNKKKDSPTIKTEVVSRGTVVASFICPAKVEPASIVSVVNPTRNSITAVYKTAGQKVEKGELILQLDKTNIQEEIARLKNQLQQKQNVLDKNKLNAKSAELDLDYSAEAKKARILKLKSTLEQQNKLLEAGGTSSARVEQIKQDIALAERDLDNQAEKNEIRLKQLQMDQQNLELQIASFKQNLASQQEMLRKTTVKAPVSGTIVELAGNIGEIVSIDEALVQIADDTAFKLLATAGKNKIDHILPGGPVNINIDGEKIKGSIGNVTVDDVAEWVQFDVFVAADGQNKLKKVSETEVEVIANDKENVLRIRKLPGMVLTKHIDVLLQKGDETIRTEIVLGTIGKDYCEVISGVNEGDIVLLAHPASAQELVVKQ